MFREEARVLYGALLQLSVEAARVKADQVTNPAANTRDSGAPGVGEGVGGGD